jgi:RNA polymerase sigma-70 factor (ECF subfamily)
MLPATSSLGIIERARQGDEEAFRWLFQRYARRLALYARFHMSPAMGARLEAEDVLQEVFLRAFRDLAHFEYQRSGAFYRWLLAIEANVLSDQARFEQRQKRKAEEVVPFRSESNPAGFEPVDSATPSRWLARKEESDRLLSRLDQLPTAYRQAIVLTRLEGLSTEEMGQRLGKDRKAAALLLHRALKRLRDLVTESDSAEPSRNAGRE